MLPNSQKDILIVMGDIFSDVSKQSKQVITESEAIDRILIKPCPERPTTLVIGQGVDHHMIESAIARRARGDVAFANVFDIRRNDAIPRAVKRLAHKDKTANILASFPEKIDETSFHLDLHFCSSNEFFNDHMTGMHIQGMALTEAARQAFLIVTEEFFLSEETADFYFVIKSFESRFLNFVFPLDASLGYKIVKHAKKPKHQSFTVAMTMLQAGQVCAEFDVSFTVFEKVRISEREVEVFQERLDTLVAAMETPRPAPVPSKDAKVAVGAEL